MGSGEACGRLDLLEQAEDGGGNDSKKDEVGCVRREGKPLKDEARPPPMGCSGASLV